MENTCGCMTLGSACPKLFFLRHMWLDDKLTQLNSNFSNFLTFIYILHYLLSIKCFMHKLN